LAEADFAGGLRPVIRFNQGAGFELENPDDLARPEFSVYVVGSVDNTLASEIFISHFKPTFGWALGISDGTAGRVKWFTSPPQSQEPSRASLGNNVPTFLTGTFGGGTKKLFVNGAEVGRVDNATVDYGGGGGVLSVGHLGCCGNIQRLKGDIAEILVYSTVSDAQRTAVEDYIRQKYFPDVVPPTVASARRLAGNAGVQVAFSEGVSAVTANARANYTISGGVVVNAAALQPDGQTVVLDTSAVGDGAVLTVNGARDRAGNTIAANSQVPIINSTSRRQQSDESDGLLVLEAEHYDVSVPGGGSEWLLTSLFPGFSGPGAMDAAPNLERNVNIDTTVSPRLDYNVQFVRSGLHYVWVRALGDSAPGPGTDDSVNVGFDQQLPATSDRITGFPHQAGFVWSQATLDNASATIDVAAAGPHSISVWMREDGLVLDKLLITSNPAYIPTGAGPNESSLSGSDLGRITIVRNGGNVVLTWTATGATLQQAASPAGPWSTAANASPFQTPSTQPARFYRLIR
jgi:hypothetical protein